MSLTPCSASSSLLQPSFHTPPWFFWIDTDQFSSHLHHILPYIVITQNIIHQQPTIPSLWHCSNQYSWFFSTVTTSFFPCYNAIILIIIILLNKWIHIFHTQSSHHTTSFHLAFKFSSISFKFQKHITPTYSRWSPTPNQHHFQNFLHEYNNAKTWSLLCF